MIADTYLFNVKVGRLKWAGHVMRMQDQLPARKILCATVEGKRARGRRKLRWKDSVIQDIQCVGRGNLEAS